MTVLTKTNILLVASAIAFASSRVNPWVGAGLFVAHAIFSQIKETDTDTSHRSRRGQYLFTTLSTKRDFEFSPVYTASAALNVLATAAMVTGIPALIAPFAAYLIMGTFAATLAKLFHDEISSVRFYPG